MNCKQCGAPTTLFRERDYYHCEHCGSYHFPNATLEGLRILGENTDGIHCPQCNISLNLVTVDDYYRGFHCRNCRGLMFNRTRFREVVDSRRSRDKTPPAPVSLFNPTELERQSECPICLQKMETFQYNGPGNIVIDTCHQDDLIWLDYGELTKVVEAPGRDRGVPRRKPEKEASDEQKKSKRDKKQSPLQGALSDLLEAFFSDQ